MLLLTSRYVMQKLEVQKVAEHVRYYGGVDWHYHGDVIPVALHHTCNLLNQPLGHCITNHTLECAVLPVVADSLLLLAQRQCRLLKRLNSHCFFVWVADSCLIKPIQKTLIILFQVMDIPPVNRLIKQRIYVKCICWFTNDRQSDRRIPQQKEDPFLCVLELDW